MLAEGKPQVLIVDDDPSSLQVMEAVLASLGCETTLVVDGEAAMEAARRVRPHLIFLDPSLPAGGGFEICGALKGDPETRHIPLIVVTSRDGRDPKIRGLSVGASDVLAKPIDPGELAARVKNLLGVVAFEVSLQEGSQRLVAQVEERTRELANINEQLVAEVAQRRKAEAELRLAAQVFDSSTSAIMIISPAGVLVAVNRAFSEITGYSKEEAVGQAPSLVLSELHDAEFLGRVWEEAERRGSWQGEIWNRRKGGKLYPNWMNVSVGRDDGGAVTHFICVFTDVTERKAAEARIQFMAHHDALTGLPNRVLLRDRFAQALAQARRAKRRVALLFLDLDRFKTINDSLGHPVGDQLLRQTGNRLRQCVREIDTVSREGGDEFLIVLVDLEGPEEAAKVAQRVLARVAEPFPLGGRSLGASLSVGISLFPDDGEDFDTLHRKADIAMYHSKESGRNAYHFFDESFTPRALERLELETHLRMALQRGELAVHYQPIVELRSRRPVGAEALLRWHSPELGEVEPTRFIPLAEETGLIVPLGQWVLEQACRQAQEWRVRGLGPLTVAVNVSSVQLRRGDVLGMVRRTLRETGLPPQTLELELTESSLIANVEQVLEAVRQLRQLGVWLSIDDFGTGYSSLAYLKRFAVHTLKIDRSFVHARDGESDAAAIVEAIVTLGRSLSLRTVAEGVELPGEVESLLRAGCTLGQGFLFAPAMPPEEFTTYLEEYRSGRFPPARVARGALAEAVAQSACR
jgi:diguanylate cyclase (GGDEF)-like protein/PAS domain S-box-containing protein